MTLDDEEERIGDRSERGGALKCTGTKGSFLQSL